MNELLKITKQLIRLWKAYFLLHELWTSFEWIGDTEEVSNQLRVKINQLFREQLKCIK